MQPISTWRSDDVSRWLRDIELDIYVERFEDLKVDGTMLVDLLENEDDLINDFGIVIRIHRAKILREINRLKVHDPSLQKSSRNLDNQMNAKLSIRHRTASFGQTCKQTRMHSSSPLRMASPNIYTQNKLSARRLSLGDMDSLPISSCSPSGEFNRLKRNEMMTPRSEILDKSFAKSAVRGAEKARIVRNDSYTSQISSRSSSREHSFHSCLGVQSVFSAFQGQASSPFGGFVPLKRMCRIWKTEGFCLENNSILDLVNRFKTLPIESFLRMVLNSMTVETPGQGTTPEYIDDLNAMIGDCTNNLLLEGYFHVNDLLQDMEEPDFRDDLRRYGMKKRFLNETWGCLAELKAYLNVDEFAETTELKRSHSTPEYFPDKIQGSPSLEQVKAEQFRSLNADETCSTANDLFVSNCETPSSTLRSQEYFTSSKDKSIEKVNQRWSEPKSERQKRLEQRERKLEEIKQGEAAAHALSVSQKNPASSLQRFNDAISHENADTNVDNVEKKDATLRTYNEQSQQLQEENSNIINSMLFSNPKSYQKMPEHDERCPKYVTHSPMSLNIPSIENEQKDTESQLQENSKVKNMLSVDVNAINFEQEIQKSYNFEKDYFQYGDLRIGKSGVAGAPGIASLKRAGQSSTRRKKRSGRGRMRQEIRLLEQVGKGAGGVVHRAVHVPSQTFVAVKQVIVIDDSQRRQMRTELDTLLYGLNHPNIVKFYDSFCSPDDGTISMVFEYMENGSLQKLVDCKQKIPELGLKNIALHCLKGLNYLHNLKYMHRDIKPSNLLLSKHGVTKIADFGIARDMDSTDEMASTYLGTFMYMSPERVRGEHYSYNCDIWSLGLSLLTFALGEYPFEVRGGPWNLAQAIREKNFPQLPATILDSEFQKMILCCLERNPMKRPCSEALLNLDIFSELEDTNLSTKELALSCPCSEE